MVTSLFSTWKDLLLMVGVSCDQYLSNWNVFILHLLLYATSGMFFSFFSYCLWCCFLFCALHILLLFFLLLFIRIF